MKYINIINGFVVVLFLMMTACTGGVREFLNIPIKGTIEGYLIDELTGESIGNALVTAHFIQPDDNEGTEKDVSEFTTRDGFFRLENVWDEARVAIEKEGFKPISFHVVMEEDKKTTFNLYTKGNPLIEKEVISHSDISITDIDTIYYFIEVTDPYNDSTEPARGDLFLLDVGTGIREFSFPLVEISHTHLFTTLEAKIPTSVFLQPELNLSEKGTAIFHFDEQVIDADGNIAFKDDVNLELIVRYD